MRPALIRSVLQSRDWFAAQWPGPYSIRAQHEAAMHVKALEAVFLRSPNP